MEIPSVLHRQGRSAKPWTQSISTLREKSLEEIHSIHLLLRLLTVAICPQNLRSRNLIVSGSSLYNLQTSLIHGFFKAVLSVRQGDTVLPKKLSQNRCEWTQI